MRQIIQLSELEGYNKDLESERRSQFREFSVSCDATKKREALESIASLTALRSATFISAYEKALGLL